MPIGMKFTLKGVRPIVSMLGRAARNVGGNRAELHFRYGVQTMNWISRNFQRQGGMLSTGPWAKLSPNTIEGRRGHTSVVLQDTGQLRERFQMDFDARETRVGTAVKHAEYHERGTGPSRPIVPKRAKILAFPHAAGRPLKKAVMFPSMGRKLPQGTKIMYSKGPIQHPGLPQRRMLPNEAEIMPALLRATLNWVREVTGRGERV